MDVGNQRLKLLASKHKDTYNAVLWLRSNKHMFKGVIHEPIMTVVSKNKYTRFTAGMGRMG